MMTNIYIYDYTIHMYTFLVRHKNVFYTDEHQYLLTCYNLCSELKLRWHLIIFMRKDFKIDKKWLYFIEFVATNLSISIFYVWMIYFIL